MSSTQNNLTTDFERGLQLQENGLAEENLPGLQTQSTDLILLQLHILAGFGSSDCENTQTSSVPTVRALDPAEHPRDTSVS